MLVRHISEILAELNLPERPDAETPPDAPESPQIDEDPEPDPEGLPLGWQGVEPVL